MICPLCGTRRARRGCPALGRQICPVCCGTKRLVEIPCPADCAYLASAREHPAAVVVQQQHRDVAFVAHAIRDFSDRQAELFFLVATTLAKHEPAALQPLIDDDVVDAVTALAGTFETSSRGVIYEHRAASLPAGRLVAALKPVVTEAGRGLGSSFERDAASVLRRIAEAAPDARTADPSNRRAFLDALGRVLARTGTPAAAGADAALAGETPRLIVP
ncbi:MAG TPA: hypothetical protein VKH42_00355 [Vicinamibacterales bacterium]|nr:hypothetical protein [Vicinamibacterales bacterium]